MQAINRSPIVLLVDDDPDDRDFFCEALRFSGNQYHALHAENGLDALEKLDRLKQSGNLPCLIILDLNMPLMDGRTALKRIREDNTFEDIPVAIFTTSKPFDADEMIVRYGIEIVEKPVNMQQIIEEINRLLVKCT